MFGSGVWCVFIFFFCLSEASVPPCPATPTIPLRALAQFSSLPGVGVCTKIPNNTTNTNTTNTNGTTSDTCVLSYDWPSQVNASAKFQYPAHFQITSTTIAENPGPFTATIAESWHVENFLLAHGYEPLTIRWLYSPTQDAENSIIASRTAFDAYNSLREDYANGASIRVFRIVNGEFKNVRNDTIEKIRISGWLSPENFGSGLVSASRLFFDVTWPSWYRPNVPYYFAVRAVDTLGVQSNISNVLEIVRPANFPSGASNAQNNASTAQPSTSTTNATQTPPQAPQNLRMVWSNSTLGVIRIAWDAPTTNTGTPLAGYAVLMSDSPPDKHSGYGIDLKYKANDTSQEIRAQDMVFMSITKRVWSRGEIASNRMWGTSPWGGVGQFPFHNDETETRRWELVAHPFALPENFLDHGETCLRVAVNDSGTLQILRYVYGGTEQQWYPVLKPNQTYTVEVWLASEQTTTVKFELTGYYTSTSSSALRKIPAINFVVTPGEWIHFKQNFSIPSLNPTGDPGAMRLVWTGPSVMFFDNFRVYRSDAEFLNYLPEAHDSLVESGLSFLRSHHFIKLPWGMPLKSLTAFPGTTGFGGSINSGPSAHPVNSLASVFRRTKLAGMNPWMQINFDLDESEWLGLVEYLAAPCPATPAQQIAMPWAHRRCQQGQATPYTSVFSKIMFEIANESWNNLFVPWVFMFLSMPDNSVSPPKVYTSGELYGKFQEFVLSIMRSSPHWVEGKIELVIGGWAVQSSTTGYGANALRSSPHSSHLTIAAYNGGWDEGEGPLTTQDSGYFSVLTQVPHLAQNVARTLVNTVDSLKVELGRTNIWPGTYEAGPGYNLNGLNGVSITAEQVEAENEVMKSMVGGTATLDAFLMRASYGFKLQNFFTFGRNRYYWVSHTPEVVGGYPYPCFATLSAFNRHASGDFLAVHPLSSPKYDLSATGTRPVAPNSAMVVAYATRKGDDVAVILISRKLDNYPFAQDGYTPVLLTLPFSTASSITLHKLTAPNPRSHNMDENIVFFEQLVVNASLSGGCVNITGEDWGVDSRGLAPGSTLIFVFSGTNIGTQQTTSPVGVKVARQVPTVAYPDTEIIFLVAFDRPVEGFGDSSHDVVLSGTAEPSTFQVTALPNTNNTEYQITVSGMRAPGTVRISIPAGAANSIQQPTVANGHSMDLYNTVTYLVSQNDVPPQPVITNSSISLPQANSVQITWTMEGGIGQMPDTFTLRWGRRSANLTHVVTNVPVQCSPCRAACGNKLCSTYALSTPIGPLNPPLMEEALFATISATNVVGESVPSLERTIFWQLENFTELAKGSGPSAAEWILTNSSMTVAIDTPTPAVSYSNFSSPTQTPLMRFRGWGSATMVRQFPGSNGLHDYTVEVVAARGGTNNYDKWGMVAHYNTTSASGVQLMIDNRSNRMVATFPGTYGVSCSLVFDRNETDIATDTPQDVGEFWTLRMSLQPDVPSYCSNNGPTVAIDVELTDALGAPRIMSCNGGVVTDGVWHLASKCTTAMSGTYGVRVEVAEGGLENNGIWLDTIGGSGFNLQEVEN